MPSEALQKILNAGLEIWTLCPRLACCRRLLYCVAEILDRKIKDVNGKVTLCRRPKIELSFGTECSNRKEMIAPWDGELCNN